MSNWKGIVVPNSEYIEKVYINKNLTPQEVEKVLSKLSFEKCLLTGTYIVTEWNPTSDTSDGLAIMDASLIYPEAGISGYVISKGLSGDAIYYISNQDVLDGINSMLGTNYDFVGWNPNIDDFLEINSLTNDTTSIQEYQNDKLSSLFSITPFEKELTLDSWAEGIADAIREKKGTTNKIPRLNFAQEIKSIQTGITPTGTFTIIENGTYDVSTYEKVVVDIQGANIQGVTFEDNELYVDQKQLKANEIVIENTSANADVIVKGDTTNVYMEIVDGTVDLSNCENEVYIEDSFTKDHVVQATGLSESNIRSGKSILGYTGTFTNDANATAQDIVAGKSAYANGEKVEGAIETYNGENEGGVIELSSGTAVPISGMIDKVYFNFNLDISKIAKIIVNLPYVEIPDFGTLYPIISNADMTDGLLILKNSDTDYYITRGVELYARLTIAGTEPEYEFRIYDNKDDSNFYKNDFTKPIEFGFENMVETLSANLTGYSNQNKLLKEMISITPIQKVGGEGIEDYNKKILGGAY